MVSLLKQVREVCVAYTSGDTYDNPVPITILLPLLLDTLLRTDQQELDSCSKQHANGKKFLLTIACSAGMCGPFKTQKKRANDKSQGRQTTRLSRCLRWINISISGT